jgi:hypothetical protein
VTGPGEWSGVMRVLGCFGCSCLWRWRTRLESLGDIAIEALLQPIGDEIVCYKGAMNVETRPVGGTGESEGNRALAFARFASS